MHTTSARDRGKKTVIIPVDSVLLAALLPATPAL